MFVLSRRLAQPRVALLATALMACSAFQVWYAQEVRMYALVTRAVLIAIYALVPAWQQGADSSSTIVTRSVTRHMPHSTARCAVYTQHHQKNHRDQERYDGEQDHLHLEKPSS